MAQPKDEPTDDEIAQEYFGLSRRMAEDNEPLNSFALIGGFIGAFVVVGLLLGWVIYLHVTGRTFFVRAIVALAFYSGFYALLFLVLAIPLFFLASSVVFAILGSLAGGTLSDQFKGFRLVRRHSKKKEDNP